MWCYQKPGFEALLLAELQRQQQCNQFCDTLIKTEGVSVPAHSCILSAISPQISSSLSALPAPPTGQSRHLDFRALGTCTLLHLVRLLYSGQMAGEGEEERQEAVSAAARLGIHGLVEVTRGRNEEGEGQHREEGVQTEPLIPGEGEERRGRWRREERNEGTFLWRETVSDGKKDTWTQTEELQVTTATPSHPAASFETIDMGALQTLHQTEPHLLPPYVSYLPVSLVYEPDETQGRNTPSTDRCWAGAAAGDLEDNQLEQFHDNIPGYINYFLNPHQEAGPRRGRKSGRRAAGTGGTRRAATGERGTRRPQAKTGGRRRGRGVLTQTVDVQSVGVSKLQKMFLQRWGMKTPRTGQGGGAVGRRLYLKTREQLKPAKSCQRKRRRGKEWDFSQSGDLREGGESNIQLYNQDGLPVGRPKRTRAKQTSAPVSSPPLKFDNVYHALSNSSPVLHSSTSAVLMSPAASYLPPAPSLFHTTSLPPAAPPPYEPEPMDRLLEEVIMGLDILPNNNSGGLNSLPLSSAGSSCTYASSGNVLTENKCVGSPPVLLEAESSRVVGGGLGRGGGVSSSAVPVLQQQGEGELNDMLENFLQSFEQHVGRWDEMERGSQSSTVVVLSEYRKTQTQTKAPRLKNTPRPLRCSQISELQQSDEAETLQSCPQLSPLAPLKHAEETVTRVGESRKNKKNQYPFSPMKGRKRKPVSSSKAREKTVHYRDKQLQQMPVVKLERSGPLPVRVTQQGRSCQSLEAESPGQTKSTPSSVKYPHGSWSMRAYPIRSRFREAHIMDSMPFLYEPLSNKKQPSDNQQPGPKRRRPKKNGLCSVSKGGSSMSSIQQQQSVNEQLEENQERQEEELNVQRQEKVGGAKRTGKRRSVESDEETVDDAPAAKKVCFKPMAHPALQTSSEADRTESASTERENLSYVDTSVRDCFQKGRGEKTARTEESSEDEEIDVDEDDEDDHNHQRIRESDPWASPPSHSAEEIRLGSTGSCEDGKDEDIDVIGGSSPVPSPVIISWSDSSEVEGEETDEDVDVVGEKTVYAPSGLFTAMSKGELENTGLGCS